jgi:hypothetical protein
VQLVDKHGMHVRLNYTRAIAVCCDSIRGQLRCNSLVKTPYSKLNVGLVPLETKKKTVKTHLTAAIRDVMLLSLHPNSARGS